MLFFLLHFYNDYLQKKSRTWQTVRGLCCFVWAERRPVPSWLATHPLPFSTCRVARPTTLREPAVRPESTTLMSSSTPAPHTGSHSLFSACWPCQRQKEWQAKPGCAYGGPALALRTSTVAPRVFHRTARPCLSADIPKCVYKDVFWQIVMWELCLSACCCCKPTVRWQLPCVCSSWGARDVFLG